MGPTLLCKTNRLSRSICTTFQIFHPYPLNISYPPSASQSYIDIIYVLFHPSLILWSYCKYCPGLTFFPNAGYCTSKPFAHVGSLLTHADSCFVDLLEYYSHDPMSCSPSFVSWTWTRTHTHTLTTSNCPKGLASGELHSTNIIFILQGPVRVFHPSSSEEGFARAHWQWIEGLVPAMFTTMPQ